MKSIEDMSDEEYRLFVLSLADAPEEEEVRSGALVDGYAREVERDDSNEVV